jgi:hypothetical protein
MESLPDPRLDKETQYLKGEYFRDQTLAEYISKAKHAQQPLGVVLVEVPRHYVEGGSKAKTLATLKDIIDKMQIQKDGKRVAFDVKARDDSKYFMIVRIAGLEDCKIIDEVLRHQFSEAGYNLKVTAKSFDPSAGEITPAQILKSLEQALG